MKWSIPEDRQYTDEHEWLQVDEKEDTRIVGITDYAQDKLGDVVFIELPASGQTVSLGQSLALVESVKAVVDVYSPVTGEILRVNQELTEKPELLNEDPYGKGWIAAIKVGDPIQTVKLMTAQGYADLIADLEKEEI